MRRVNRNKAVRWSLLIGAAFGTTLVGSASAQAQIQPHYGNLNPFYGNIDPMYGTINPFYGTINPFWGNINPFWGNINPFWGNINPFWGTINPFYGTINPFYGNLNPFWGATASATAVDSPAYAAVGTYWQDFGASWQTAQPLWSDPLKSVALGLTLNEIIAKTDSLWGATLLRSTGKSFVDGVGRELFARHGIDPANGASLQKLTAQQRARFLLDWYDTLMKHSGRNHIDHWMGTANWTPAITQIQGSGTDAVIGLIDGHAIHDADAANNIVYRGGYSSTVNGHGAGVGSLLVGAHDGTGVMGIAPNAKLAVYNPFDASNSASWTDLRQGIVALKGAGASVINMSLGVSGWTLHPDWRLQFSNSAIAPFKGNTVYVLAAGNDGITQTRNVEWEGAMATAFIVVGSVDMAGNISTFSNRPGTTCLLDDGECDNSNRLNESGALMNRFIVAPGELIMVADGKGGVTRMSGTSFAAPLVSGAIALLYDRWPWMRSNPHDAVEIILRSARDLGAPGVDPVYGRGLLDIAASQSPLDFNKLTFYEARNGEMVQRTASEVQSGGVKSTWEADGVYFYMFETVGNTKRDFVVPLSSKLVGTITAGQGTKEHFHRYVSKRMTDWIKGSSGFTDVSTFASSAAGGWGLAMSSGSRGAFLQDSDGRAPHSAVQVSGPNGRLNFTVGFGEGAMALAPQTGFGLSTDYASDGGVNPLMGFASGGAFVSTNVAVSGRTAVSLGFTEHSVAPSKNLAFSETDRAALRDLAPYKAGAINLRFTHRVSKALGLSLSYARLRESDALLGVQSSVEGDLRHGSASETATLGATLDLPRGLTLAASATAGRTHANSSDQSLRTSGGVLSSAYAFAATKIGVLGDADMLRLSLAQPLHIERGKLIHSGGEVIDRSTGKVGIAEHSFDISSKDRRYTAEMLYASPLMEGGGEASLFGRVNLRSSEEVKVDDFIVGGRLSVRF